MSGSSLKERIFGVLLECVICFVSFTVISKLLFNNEDWLIHSIMWSIFVPIGDFVSDTVAKITANKNIREKIFFKVIISIAVIFVVLFITGVILNLSNWYYIARNTCIPFTIPMLISNWKK